MPPSGFLVELKDGTFKQRNPFTGTQVWTIPGRADRPIAMSKAAPVALNPADMGHHCAFCSKRYLETPPEKSRIVQHAGNFEQRDGVSADELTSTVAEFRRIPNLYEILSLDFWRENYGYELPREVLERQRAYLESSTGRAHVAKLLVTKRNAPRVPAGPMHHTQSLPMVDDALAEASAGFFGGGHDVIVARRHYVDGAKDDSELASSGTLTPDEHAAFMQFTADAARNIVELNPYARYAAVFQNWLRPAGASFDHLHKQIVAIDEHGDQLTAEMQAVRRNLNVFNEVGPDFAAQRNLVIGENHHAIAYAGFGHRYPTIEVFSKAAECEPWAHSPEAMRGVSDMVHAMHAATGPDVPINEEWHYRPVDGDQPQPWRIMMKWRVSTIAGFEGATKIYLNTLSPASVVSRIVPALKRLRDEGVVGPMQVGPECRPVPNALRYASRA
ncbi:MAG: DUF4921 family protein [Cellulomonadaceae bacterium]|jgi:galactose-1-phosphate uridylyltransferase|nr:DUF4921 family protein [Cellulomonadaceae bacterium]